VPDSPVVPKKIGKHLFLWSELRQNIIDEHIKHRPGTRPWSWWHLEDRELRREGESEASYLKRLRLFLPGEKQPKEDWGRNGLNACLAVVSSELTSAETSQGFIR
jgi:hypothetical protein